MSKQAVHSIMERGMVISMYISRKKRKHEMRISVMWVVAVALVLYILGSIVGHKMHQSTVQVEDTPIDCKISPNALSGSATMAGSTAMEKVAGILAESFMQQYPGVTVTVEFTGSSAGIRAVLAGSVDIGNSSRSLRAEEKAWGAVENIVAVDGIVVVTDADNPVTSLTTEQLSDIYTGKIRNWRDVGGMDEPVVVIGREAGSGTRCAFEELLGIEEKCAYANELDSTGAVMARAATIPGAIGYVSLDVLNDSVQVIAIDGIKPTPEAIQSGSYLLQRPFVMVTDGELSVQSEIVQEFFVYLKSQEGRSLIRSVGLIPVNDG